MQRAGIAGSSDKVRSKVLTRHVTQRVGMYPIGNNKARKNDIRDHPGLLDRRPAKLLLPSTSCSVSARDQGSKAQPCPRRRAISASTFSEAWP
jgi:hypothetical protein